MTNTVEPDGYQLPKATSSWSAILFDVDGVLLNSGDAHRAVWHEWARRRDLDPFQVHAATQGRRRTDILQLLAPERPADEEDRLLNELMAAHEPDIAAYPGVADLLAGLPAWAVVTSSRRTAVVSRFRNLGLPVPEVRICAEDVPAGKPSPDGYLAAAAALATDPADCLVVEDSPAGIEAGIVAGCTVHAVATTHAPADLARSHANFATLQDLARHLTTGSGQ